MDIHQLRIFAAVYRYKSFTKAAEILSVSQPTISEHIKNLEYDAGCKLFDRLGRFIKATSEADILYPKAVMIIEDIERIKEEITSSGVHIQGELCIGASSIPGTYLLPGLAMEFRKANPGVTFKIHISDSAGIMEMIATHELLCGVVGAKPDNEQLDCFPFVEDELVMVCRPDFYEREIISKNGLWEIPFIVREQGSGTRKNMEIFLKRLGLSVDDMNISAELSSGSAVKEAVKSGLCASILSRLAVQEELKNKTLKRVEMEGLEMRRMFYLIQHRRRTMPVRYQKFCQMLKQVRH